MRTVPEKLVTDLIIHIPKVIEHLDRDIVRKKLRLNNSVRILDNCVRKLSQTKTPKRNEAKQNNTQQPRHKQEKADHHTDTA